MMWKKIQVYVVAGLSIALAVLYALFKGEQASGYRDKLKVAQKASKALSEANTAIHEADVRGKERLNEKDPDRNHFS